ncbi:hypothetical protein ACFVYE_42625 [Streptomyces sp. NPDC058239]|uniref:hypothetical protein n=1 Tax=unclassified Streptomyces TaxID=2593676 RepID=UPI00365BD927
MGLCLFPDAGDVSGPDLSLSCSGFKRFRRRLARAEGFDLPEMRGFGGDRSWGDVSTALAPFLDHPDDDGELSVAECDAVLPRLEEIIARWEADGGGALLQQHIEYGHQLATVLRLCVEKDVELIFG